LLENDDSELDLMSALQSQLASQNSTRKKQVVNALLYGLLTDKDRGTLSSLLKLKSIGNDYFMFLAVFVWDNFRGIVQYMLHFCGEVFPFMQIHAKHQLFWLIDQLLGKQIPEMDVVIFKLLRNVSGCDLSSSSIAIVKIVLGLLNKHKIWVLRHPKIVSMSVYVFLRCLVAHDTITDLKNSEILYCEEMLRTRFVDCAKIGRDLIRALLDLRHIPQLESLLKEIVVNTGSIPGCTSLEILLHTPTSKQYHQVRTSFQIEKQLLFIMQNVILDLMITF
jgi:integrator complex subunit 3